MEQIEQDFQKMEKKIKDLTFSYIDKQGEFWDDRKKNERKFDY